MSEDPFVKLFPNYIRLFEQLQAEYVFTPEWMFWRKLSLLRQMHRVNLDYIRWFNEYVGQKSK
jgi:hypothetical protein